MSYFDGENHYYKRKIYKSLFTYLNKLDIKFYLLTKFNYKLQMFKNKLKILIKPLVKIFQCIYFLPSFKKL